MLRLSGTDALAVRASKKQRSDELLLPSFAATRLKMELDKVPLLRGDHVEVKQLAEDFARYVYLPRLKESSVLLNAISYGVSLLTWEQVAFAFADNFDASAGRYKGPWWSACYVARSQFTGLFGHTRRGQETIGCGDTATGGCRRWRLSDCHRNGSTFRCWTWGIPQRFARCAHITGPHAAKPISRIGNAGRHARGS